MRWIGNITDSVSMNSSKLWYVVKDSLQQSMGWQRVRHGLATERRQESVNAWGRPPSCWNMALVCSCLRRKGGQRSTTELKGQTVCNNVFDLLHCCCLATSLKKRLKIREIHLIKIVKAALSSTEIRVTHWEFTQRN